MYAVRRAPFFYSKRFAFVLLICLLAFNEVSAWRRKNIEVSVEDDESFVGDIDDVPWLIKKIGKQIYMAANLRKYRLYLYLTIGGLPSEENSIILLNSICNLLYGISILIGFLIFPRGYMLLASLLTLFIGPAIILLGLGFCVGMLGAFTVYPVISVLVMWVFFFLTSRLAQVLGIRFGLDHDGDGDVNLLDLLHWASETRLGQALDLASVYSMFNDSSLEPLREINRRLIEIQENTQTIGKSLRLGSVPTERSVSQEKKE